MYIKENFGKVAKLSPKIKVKSKKSFFLEPVE